MQYGECTVATEVCIPAEGSGVLIMWYAGLSLKNIKTKQPGACIAFPFILPKALGTLTLGLLGQIFILKYKIMQIRGYTVPKALDPPPPHPTLGLFEMIFVNIDFRHV